MILPPANLFGLPQRFHRVGHSLQISAFYLASDPPRQASRRLIEKIALLGRHRLRLAIL